MFSRKKSVPGLIGVTLIGILVAAFAISVFSVPAFNFTGGPNGNGTASLFLALEPAADPNNPVPISTMSLKPNKTFKVRLYLDVRNLLYSNDQTGIVNQLTRVAAQGQWNIKFDPAFVTLVAPQKNCNTPNDPAVNPGFAGMTAPFDRCTDYIFGPANLANVNTPGRISLVDGGVSTIGDPPSNFPAGLIALNTYNFVTGPNTGGPTTIDLDPPIDANITANTGFNEANDGDVPNSQAAAIPFQKTNLTLTVANAAPTVTSTVISKEGDAARNVNIVVNDADGDPVTVSSVTQPTLPGATLNCPSGAQAVPFNCTLSLPALGFTSAGNFTAAVSASDGAVTTNQTINITVGNVNRPPTLAAIANQSRPLGSTTNIPLSATDPDPEDNNITFSITNVTPALNGVTLTPSGSNTSGNINVVVAGNAPAAVYTVTVTANDNDAVTPQAAGSGPLTDSKTFTLTIFKANTAPVFGTPAPANTTVNENATASFNIQANDVDVADSLSFALTQQDGTAAPSFITLTNQAGTNPRTATVSIDLTNNFTAAGTYQLRVRVTDNNTNNDPNGVKTADTNFTVTVVNVNRAPTLAPLNAASVVEAATLDVPLSANDPDGNSTLTFSVAKTTGPGTGGFVTITNPTTNGTATLHIAPTIGDNGTYTFTVTVNDNDSTNPLTATQTIGITVTYNNRAPTLNQPANVTITESQTAQVQLTSTDADRSRIVAPPAASFNTLQITPLNTELTVPNTSFITQIDNGNGTATININPTGNSAGTYTVVATVNDNDNTGPAGPNSGAKTGTTTFTVTINNVPPTTPVFGSQPPATINEGQTFSTSVTSTDIGGNTLLALTVSPSCTLAPGAQPGNGRQVAARSGTVSRVVGGRTATTGGSRTNAPGDFITLVDNGNGTGTLNINPTFADAGQCTVTVTSTEKNIGNNVPGGHSASTQFSLTVNDVNRPVTFTAGPTNNQTFTVKETETQDVQLTATDLDTNNTLTFSLTNAPAFITITNATSVNGVANATLHIAPPILAAQNSPYNNIVVKVDDAHGSNDTRTFNVIVTPANRPPVLTVNPTTVNVTGGTVFNLPVSATDPDSGAPLNQNVTISLSGAPSFVTIGATTKDANSVFNATIRFAPSLANVGQFTFNVVATDNGTPNLTDTKTITLNVLNTPQVILVAPNGGNVLTGGTNFQISWTASAASGVNRLRQRLLLSTDGGATFPFVISNGIAGGTQTFNWTVPNIATTTARVRIEVTEPACTGTDVTGQCNGTTIPADRTSGDNSDANFTIQLAGAAPQIALISPTNGDAIIAGPTSFDTNGNPVGTQAPFPIAFVTTGLSATSFTIDLSLDGGATFTNIGTTAASPFNWTVPTVLPDGTEVATNNGVIRVTGGSASASATGLKIAPAPVITRAKYLLPGDGRPTNELQITGLGFVQDEMDIIVCDPTTKVCSVKPTLTRSIRDANNGVSFLLIFQDSGNVIPFGTPVNLQVRNKLTGAISKQFSFIRTVR